MLEVNHATLGSAAVPLDYGQRELLYLVGNILLGVAVWRSGTLPKLAGALYAPTGLVMLAGQFVGVFQTVAMVMLIGASAWIAWSVMRRPAAEKTVVGAQAQASVQ